MTPRRETAQDYISVTFVKPRFPQQLQRLMRFRIVGAAVAPSSSLGGANEPSAGAFSMHTCLLRRVRWGARRVTAAALISITTGSCGGNKENDGPR